MWVSDKIAKHGDYDVVDRGRARRRRWPPVSEIAYFIPGATHQRLELPFWEEWAFDSSA